MEVAAGTKTVDVPLDLKHSITEINFACVDDESRLNNDRLNYAVRGQSLMTQPMIQSASIPQLMDKEQELYLRTVTRQQAGLMVPNKYIYSIVFGCNTTVNFSKQPESRVLRLEYADSVPSHRVWVVAQTRMIVGISCGQLTR